MVGDVVAIEPGLYIPGVGGTRFERNHPIVAEGFETLPRRAIEISPQRNKEHKEVNL